MSCDNKGDCLNDEKFSVRCCCSFPCLSRCPADGSAWLDCRRVCPVCKGRPCWGGPNLPRKFRAALNRTIVGDGTLIKNAAVFNLTHHDWETVTHPDLDISFCELKFFVDAMEDLDEDHEFSVRGNKFILLGCNFTCIASCHHPHMYDIPIMVLKQIVKPASWCEEDNKDKTNSFFDDCGGVIITKTTELLIFTFHGKLGNPGEALHIAAEMATRLRDMQL